MVKTVDVKEFKSEVKKGIVVVDFFATWCGPCKMLSSVMDELSKELDGKAKFIKIDVDENPELADELKIMSIPTTMVFKNGENKKAIIGFLPKDEIKKNIESQL